MAQAGRPTRWEQIALILEKAEGYIDRASKIVDIANDAPHTAVRMNFQALRDSISRFKTHFDSKVNAKSWVLEAREQWEANHKNCACCYAHDSEIPLVTAHILTNHRKHTSELPWNWLRLCTFCDQKRSLKVLKFRLWLKHEADPYEYDWLAANTWWRTNCRRDAAVNWIAKPLPPLPQHRQPSPQVLELRKSLEKFDCGEPPGV